MSDSSKTDIPIASAEQAHAAKDSPTLQGWRQKAVALWQLLDDIDTASDAAKADDAAYRRFVEGAQRKRFDVMSGDEYDAAFDHHHEAGGAPGREGWRSADQTPTVTAGLDAYFIVAVRRAHNGKVFSFPATYLNSMVLDFEDEGETRPTTGWFSATADEEDHRSYQPLLSKGDELVAWREVPQFDAENAKPSDHEGREQVISELCEARKTEVATIIDPHAFDRHAYVIEHYTTRADGEFTPRLSVEEATKIADVAWGRAIKDAYAKAETILALPTARPEGC